MNQFIRTTRVEKYRLISLQQLKYRCWGNFNSSEFHQLFRVQKVNAVDLTGEVRYPWSLSIKQKGMSQPPNKNSLPQ